MVKPEVRDRNSTGATCASNKDKTLRTDKNHDQGENNVLSLKHGSENKEHCDMIKKYNFKLQFISDELFDDTR